MFSEKLRNYAQEHIDNRLHMLGGLKDEIEDKLKGCTPDEQALMKFFYGTMPIRDAGEYDFEVFLGFVRHALMVYDTMDWCRKLPEDIFLNDVLYYRVNNENIEDCRRFFYDRLIDRVRMKTAKEAVLEINYWCAEHASYEASDNRTISPLGMYRAGKGRCGEESTFAVTAFRSVGIPARQVYTPRWAHCDDNHAWVEVYVDGQWHFLGACEPEEVLDRGWFKNASSRTMMVHAREFSDYSVENGGQQYWREGCLCYRNVTSSYTETGELRVKVAEADGTPAENARVFVEVLNSAEFANIAVLVTDAARETSLCLGKGTVHLWAVKDGRIGETLIHTQDVSEVLLTIKEEPQHGFTKEAAGQRGVFGWTEMDIKAPKEASVYASHVTREQKIKNRERVLASAEMRKNRIAGFFQEELGKKYPEEREILRLASGNFEQVYAFLDQDTNPDRKGMLHALSEKDYKDVTADLLNRHLSEASRYRAEWEERGELDIYTRYILCPRIYFEELTCYRKELLDWLEEGVGAGEIEKFRKEPRRIWEYVREQVGYDEKYDYSALLSTPVNTLKIKLGSPLSRKILCTAICRTLGVPARLNQATREAEVYRDGRFVKISGVEEGQPETAALVLKRQEGEEWNYYQNWTIGQYRQGCFVTLDYQELQFEGNELRMDVEPGLYRILTANRMPSGNQLAAECKFYLDSGQTFEVEMYLRQGDRGEMLVSNQLEDFELAENGVSKPAASLIGNKAHILMFLAPGEEPTEHVLNEMLTLQETLRRMDAGLCFVLQEGDIQRTAAWEKVLEAFPDGKVVCGVFDDIVEPLARRMYVDPEKLPLMILVNPGLRGIFACSGYRVGSVKLALDLLKVSKECESESESGFNESQLG